MIQTTIIQKIHFENESVGRVIQRNHTPEEIEKIYKSISERFSITEDASKEFTRQASIRAKQICDRHKQELVGNRGKRYEGSRFSNYAATIPEQKTVVTKLMDYCENAEKNISEGNGVAIYGPKGTGKDHLAMAVCHELIYKSGVKIKWVNGVALYAAFRDCMNHDSAASELEVVNKFASPEVLYISDPLPPAGILTDYQMAALFNVLDERYSRQLPTIVTINVQTGEEMDRRLGPQNGDRIRDGALAVKCSWLSYRKAL